MAKHYIHFANGLGLGNQLYLLAYTDYLKSLGADASLFLMGDSQVGDTKDKAKRNLVLEIPQRLGMAVVDKKQISRSFRYIFCKAFYGKEKLNWREPKNQWAVFFEGVHGKYPVNFYYGYFQSHHYIAEPFKQQLKTVLRALKPVDVAVGENDVAVHIRRGDFLNPENAGLICTVGLDYYLNGLDYIRQRQTIGTVYIFSDDFAAIEKEIAAISAEYSVRLMQGQSVLEDMNWLTYFKHYVVGNSTFAWWGCLLSDHQDGLVVVPQRPWVQEQPASSQYLPHWVQLPND